MKKIPPPHERGDEDLEPFTVKVARRVVQDVIDRLEGGTGMPKKRGAEAEIDDLVDDLDEIEDEDDEDEDDAVEDEDDDDDDEDEDEDPDEAPKKKSRKSKKSKASKSKKSAKKAKPEKEGVGTAELAEAAGVDSRQLRMYLRSQEVQPRDDRDGRYWWPSLNDKQVQRIIKAVRGGAVDKMNKDKLADLKGKKSKKASTKKASSKKSKKTKK